MSSPGNTQQIIYLTNTQFLANTRPKRMKIASNQPYVDGGINRYNLQQTGLADKLMLYVSASIVVAGTITSGTFNGFSQGMPAPWSIFKNVQFGSNNNLTLRNFSGWSMYKWVRNRYCADPMKCTAVNYSTNTLAALGLNQGSNNIVAGANVAAQTYTFNVAIPIDLAYNQTAEQGLLSLQNGNIIYTLTVQWGQITGGITATGGSNDLFNALVGTGLSVTATIGAYVGMDVWDYPNLASNVSLAALESTFVSVSDSIQANLNTGTNTYKPPQNDIYTQIGIEVINNGAPVAVANIQNPQWLYAGNVYPMVEDYQPLLVRDYFEHGIPQIDGNIWYDLGMRRGERLRRDMIDGFNDMSITNLQIQFTLPNSLSITGTNQMNVVLENVNQFAQQ